MTITSDKLGALKRTAKRQGWLKWIRSAADEHALLKGCRFDIARAEHVEEFLATFLVHTQDPFRGKPFTLQTHQRDDLFYPLFGWVKTDERGHTVRRYRKAYVEKPKKNGKSTEASGIGLYMLVADGEGGAEIYSAASDRNQANIVHREACNMVESSPILSKALTLNRATWNIAYPKTTSFYRALASTPKSNEGFKPHCIIADELHTWTGERGRDLYDCLRWGFASRTQPLFFQITTAGDDPLSVCREQHDYSQKIIDGTIFDDSFFPLIYAAGKDDNPWKESTWKKANPSLGTTITLESFKTDAAEAKRTPTATARFKRYRLNIWTTGDNAWLPIAKWNERKIEFTEETLTGRSCFAAIDLSRISDTTSLQLIFPPDDPSEPYYLLSYFWLPEATAKELSGVVPYDLWAEQNLITLTPGNVVDYAFIEREIGRISQLFTIDRLTFDPLFAEDVTQRIESEFNIPRESFAQTIMNFARPTAEFERLVIADALPSGATAHSPRQIAHNGHALMDWQIGNVCVRCDASGNKRPLKPNNPMDRRKVDGPVAAVMALGLALKYGPLDTEDFYEHHALEIG